VPKDERDKAAEAWLNFTRLHKELHAPQLPLQDRSFLNSAWRQFDPKAVASILLDERESFFAHKEVLFAGFTGWVVDPQDTTISRSAMMLSALAEMSRSEKLAVENADSTSLFADWLVRYEKIGIYFLEQIYYPMGGIRAFSSAPSTAHMVQLLNRNRAALRAMALVMKYYHYVTVELSPKTGRAASLHGIYSVIGRMREDIKNDKVLSDKLEHILPLPSPGAIKDYWRRRSTTLSLIYAASTISLDNEETLLDRLVNGQAQWRHHRANFAEWLGRARWCDQNILGKSLAADFSKKLNVALPKVPPLLIPVPKLSDEEMRRLSKGFRPIAL
jgi:hypothetical protein